MNNGVKNSKASKDARANNVGHLHPHTHVLRQMNEIFTDLGFSEVHGPQIESEYYNFDALNIPGDHPARDMWDTFWLKENKLGDLLRTHTSPMQVRYMENRSKNEPPLAIIVPGKVFRYEATDATHEAQFLQLEGLMLGKDVTLATLKRVLTTFFERFFCTEMDVRLRPSFFPFVEPGVEVDMTCFKCAGESEIKSDESCSVCKGTKWVEIMGAGMVHPFVLENVGIDSREWQGFAFGMGVDRLGMLKYGIPDIRLFYGGDLRLTNQF